MSKMKNLFIDMMNEDWERLSLHEKSFIMAEKDHYERQIMQELWEEEQKQAKIVQDDTNQEVREDIELRPRPESSDVATIRVTGSQPAEPNGQSKQGGELDADARTEGVHS